MIRPSFLAVAVLISGCGRLGFDPITASGAPGAPPTDISPWPGEVYDPLGPPSMMAVEALRAGGDHTCLTSEGVLHCFGRNEDGQVGDGGTRDRYLPSPLELASPSQLALGAEHTCAIVDGDVMCWGEGDLGQLGTGAAGTRRVPTPVRGLPAPAVLVAAGAAHTCAGVDDDGDEETAERVFCWGSDADGGIGGRATETCSDRGGAEVPCATAPVEIEMGAIHFVALVAGAAHGCALSTEGRLECWGDGGQGQLGEALDALGPLDRVAAGGAQTCATRDRDVWCWGDGSAGLLGSSLASSATPVRVGRATSPPTSLAVGLSHACFVDQGDLFCWGSDADGQVTGDAEPGVERCGAIPCVTAPRRVAQVRSLEEVSAGHAHTCAVDSDGHPLCFGADLRGQLGRGVSRLLSQPTRVNLPPGEVVAVDASDTRTCVVVDGAVHCAGRALHGEHGSGSSPSTGVPVRVPGMPTGEITALAVGSVHVCGVVDGGVACWGYNVNGRLGRGSWERIDEPAPEFANVLGRGAGVRAMSAGDNFTCAVTDGGAVYCWGYGEPGTIGDGAGVSRIEPTLVESLDAGALHLSSGVSHSCAAVAGGLRCWGAAWSDVLGIPRSSAETCGEGSPCMKAPVMLDGFPAVTALGGGGNHSCAVSDGSVLCWGRNWDGQLGDGDAGGNRHEARPVLDVERATSVAAGFASTCAIEDGLVRCWGDNREGELGNGRPGESSATPSDGDPTLPRFLSIAAGDRHYCAIGDEDEDGVGDSLYCWGSDAWGQLAMGTRLTRIGPGYVRFLPGRSGR